MHNKLLNSALTLINIYPDREEKWMVYAMCTSASYHF